MVDQAPRALAGRYEVGTLIGRGGMADVHIGRDTRLGRTVAIKILRSDLARDPSFQARFRREAQAAAALNHPSIVAVYDTGEDTVIDPTGASAQVPFIVMEYVEGQTVREILRDGQAVPLNEAAEILDGVLSALDYSHRAGIVHRDIKPANVMITATGSVKVMDFGIARAVADSAATMTQASSVIGTAQYLSPEQARGEVVDARSDIYSAGCLLYELLSGRPPFSGDSPVAVAYQHVREAPPKPSAIASDVPEQLDRITLRALAKDKGDRYQSAADFRADLQAFARGGALEAPALPIVTAAAAGAEPKDVNAGPPTAATQAFTPAGDSTQAMPAWGAVNAGQQASPANTAAFPPVNGPGGPGASAWGQPTGAIPAVEEEEEKSNKKLAIILTIVGVVVVGLIVGIIMMLNNGDKEPAAPEQVAVPALEGMDAAAARVALEEVELVFDLGEPEASATIPEGEYVSSNPAVDEMVDVGSTVTVRFSSGPGTVEVPDLSDWTQEEAVAELERLGLELDASRESVNHCEIEDGRVVSTTPGAGETVNEGDSIRLSISNGRCIVPNVVDKSLEDATAELRDLGFDVTSDTRADADAEAGTVLEQSPRANEEARQGETIHLIVAEAVETVTIPDDIIGQQGSYIQGRLEGAGLTVVIDPRESDEPAGIIIGSDPEPGSEVEVGGTVRLIVSSGPAETTPPPEESEEGEG